MRAGEVTLIAGANGVGKSALLYDLYKSMPLGGATYYPGHRQITFNNGWDNLQQDMTQLVSNFYNHYDAFNRYKGSWGEDHFKSVVKKLGNRETIYRGELFLRIRDEEAAAIAEAKELQSPLGHLNAIFSAAGLMISLSLDETGLLVSRGEARYRIDQMSDGERAALFVVGAILTQQSDTIIMIDEPETARYRAARASRRDGKPPYRLAGEPLSV